MENVEDRFKGFILWEGGKGIRLAKSLGPVDYRYDDNQPFIKINIVPEPDEQKDFLFDTRQPLLRQKYVICEINPEEAFNFLRAKIMVERLKEGFSEVIKGSVPVLNGIILITPFISSSLRRKICCAMGRCVYTENQIWFCSHDEITDNVLPIQKALLKKNLLPDWEMVRGDELRYSTQYVVI